MLPLLTAATARELMAALPQGTALTAYAPTAGDSEQEKHAAHPPSELHEHSVYTMCIAGQPWLACLTGVGPINAALAMGLALARCPAITAVLNVGLAGTFDLTRAPLGSTIAVTQEIWPEYGLADDADVDAAGLGFPLWIGGADGAIIDRLPLSVDPVTVGLPPLPCTSIVPHTDSADRANFPKEAGGADGAGQKSVPGFTQGISLTVAGVTNSAARAQRLHHKYAALIENMEGFAVALACARHTVPLVELRTISNVTGSRLPQDRNFPLAFSAMNLFFTTYFTHTQYYYAHTQNTP